MSEVDLVVDLRKRAERRLRARLNRGAMPVDYLSEALLKAAMEIEDLRKRRREDLAGLTEQALEIERLQQALEKIRTTVREPYVSAEDAIQLVDKIAIDAALASAAPSPSLGERVLTIIATRKRCEHIPGVGLPDGRVHTITALSDIENQVKALLAEGR